MRYAIIANGTVENVIDYDTEPSSPPPGFGAEYTAVATDVAGPGWIYADGTFTNPDPTPPSPLLPNQMVITDRQFFQMLAYHNLITQDEAKLATGPGTIPAAMQAVVDALPEQDRFDAEMKLMGEKVFDFDSPLVQVFAAANNINSAQAIAMWNEAAAL